MTISSSSCRRGNSWYVKLGGERRRAEEQLGRPHHPGRDRPRRLELPDDRSPRGPRHCGLSMGGYGALTLGLRHPECFISSAAQWRLEHGRQAAPGPRFGAAGAGAACADRRRECGRGRSAAAAESRDRHPGFSSQEETPQGHGVRQGRGPDAYDPFTLINSVPKRKCRTHLHRLRHRRSAHLRGAGTGRNPVEKIYVRLYADAAGTNSAY